MSCFFFFFFFCSFPDIVGGVGVVIAVVFFPAPHLHVTFFYSLFLSAITYVLLLLLLPVKGGGCDSNHAASRLPAAASWGFCFHDLLPAAEVPARLSPVFPPRILKGAALLASLCSLPVAPQVLLLYLFWGITCTCKSRITPGGLQNIVCRQRKMLSLISLTLAHPLPDLPASYHRSVLGTPGLMFTGWRDLGGSVQVCQDFPDRFRGEHCYHIFSLCSSSIGRV